MQRNTRNLCLDICDYNNNVLCNLYDNTSDASGQATDVFVHTERNGWKELTFTIPSTCTGENGEEENYRLDYLVADYRIRLKDDNETDWYLVSEPKISHNAFSKTVDVTAGHISQILKTKNLNLVFSDDESNNVGTARQFLDAILEGTGWTAGEVADFYEDDGETIKIRTLNDPEKTGAFKLIADMCELFDAKAVYHGEGRTVDILPLNPFSDDLAEGEIPEKVLNQQYPILEMHYDKNVKSITRTMNTENMITKLYAYGSYGDMTGMCSIQTGKHVEFKLRFSGEINEENEYYFIDNTNTRSPAAYYFTLDYEPEAGTEMIWSRLDFLSRSYVWDGEKAYHTYKIRKTGSPTLLEFTSETVQNYVPALMSFDYYEKIGLLSEDQFQELADYQRTMPGLYKDSTEKASAFTDSLSVLSETAESSTGFLKLAVKSYDKDNNGNLVINIDTDQGDNGVLYRSDYDENRKNFFSWYAAGALKDNGDPVTNIGSMVWIIHEKDGDNPVTWEKSYVKQINDIVDESGNPTHYYYGLTEGDEPYKITLHMDKDDAVGLNKDTDNVYLFCSRSMSGRLGSMNSADEAAVITLNSVTTNQTVKHPVYFGIENPDDSLLSSFAEYAWYYQYTKDYEIGKLFMCRKSDGDGTWYRLYFADTKPALDTGCYFYDTKYKTLWYGGTSDWVQMTTARDEDMAPVIGTVIQYCNERDRYYKGVYEEYYFTPDEDLTVDNYAFATKYDAFWTFTTDQVVAAGDSVCLNTKNNLLYQDVETEDVVEKAEKAVSVVWRKSKTITFPSYTILGSTVYTSGSISVAEGSKGVDIDTSGKIRSGYIRVADGFKYLYNLPSTGMFVYYDANKNYIKHESFGTTTGSFTTPKASSIRDASQVTIDDYTAGAYYLRIVLDSIPTPSHYIQLEHYENKFWMNDKLYTILGNCDDESDNRFTTSGEILGILDLMEKFVALADKTYLVDYAAMKAAQQAVSDRNLQMTEILQDLLKEGYWQEDNYAEGDEDKLYKDSLDNLKEISKPEITYDIEFLDNYTANKGILYYVSEDSDLEWPDIQITDAVHLIDEDIDTNLWAYIYRLNKCYDQPWKTTLEINTKLSLMDQHDFSDVMAHIANVANETKANQSLYRRAAALTGSGQLAADRLTGAIQAYKTKFAGGASNWYTDDNGNIVFESADGTSAMSLQGYGFCIASSKDKYGDWEWMTFGTGDGLVANSITTGYLSSTLIQSGSIETDKLSASVGSELELTSNKAIVMCATVDGSRTAGGVLTPTVEEDDSYIEIAAKNGDDPAYINIMTGGKLNLHGSSVNIQSDSTMNITSGEKLTVTGGTMEFASGGKINVTTAGTFAVESQNFTVTDAGTVTITGTINAAGGTIAGLKVGKTGNVTYLYTDDHNSLTSSNNGVYLGTDGISVGNNVFYVAADGSQSTLNAQTISVGSTNASGQRTAYFTMSGDTATLNSGTINVSAASTINVSADSTINVNSDKKLTLTTNGTLTVGKTGSTFTIGGNSTNAYIYNTGGKSYMTSPNAGIYLGTNGIALGATVNGVTPFSVTSAGVLTANSGTIGSWSIGSTYLGNASTETGSSVGLKASTTSNDVVIWAGSSTKDSANFSVTAGGALTAKSASITGGTIGGFTITGSSLYSGGSAYSTSIVGIRPGTASSNVVIWAGGDGTNSIASAAFRVKRDGSINVGITTLNNTDYPIFQVTSSGTLRAGPYMDDDTQRWHFNVSTTGNLTTRGSITAYGNITASGLLSASNIKVTGGTVGGFTVTTDSNGDSVMTGGSGSSSIGMDGVNKTTHPWAFWAGSGSADDAPFRVDKEGHLYVTKLAVRGSSSSSSYSFIDFSNFDNLVDNTDYAFWKLKYATIKSVGSDGTVTLSDNSTFSSAASVKLSASWNGAGDSFYYGSLILRRKAGSETLSGSDTIELTENVSEHKVKIYSDTLDLDNSLSCQHIYNAGKNSVTGSSASMSYYGSNPGGTYYLGHISKSGDAGYYKFTITLSNSNTVTAYAAFY